MALLPRTLLLLDEPFVEVGGVYHCPFVWWRFADKLAEHCESCTLYVPLKENAAAPTGPAVELKRARLVGRPYYWRLKHYYAQLPFIRARLRRQARELVAAHDLVIVRIAAPVAGFVIREAARARKPLAMLLCGDVLRQSTWVSNRRGPVLWAGRLAAGIIRRQEYGFARRCAFVGAWGEELREEFAPYCSTVEIVQDPTIEEKYLTRREDTCTEPPTRLVRVCRLLRSKGLEFLLEAVAKLIENGRPVKLDIAGGGDDPAYVETLRRHAEHVGISDKVVFHGNLPFGEQLFELYRSADIHVVSSLSEGLPRCIAEGRAFCLPTVATAVSGIPSVVHDGEDGLLVEPADADDLAAAIGRIIDDGELRRYIIGRSFEIAKRSTAEYHAERLARLIAEAAQVNEGR